MRVSMVDAGKVFTDKIMSIYLSMLRKKIGESGGDKVYVSPTLEELEISRVVIG